MVAAAPSSRARLFRLAEVVAVALAAVGLAALAGLLIHLTPSLGSFTFGWFVGTYGFAYGTLGVAVVVYVLLRHGRAYLDLSPPSFRDLRDVLVAFIAVVGGVAIVSGAAALAGLPVLHAGSVGDPVDPPLLLAAIPLTLALGVPAQELLFRNVCQKRLGERFPAWVAVGVPSLLMVAFTLGPFLGAPALGLVVPALAVAVASNAIGLVYARSGSLVAAWSLHAALTMALLSLLYLDASTTLELSSLA